MRQSKTGVQLLFLRDSSMNLKNSIINDCVHEFGKQGNPGYIVGLDILKSRLRVRYFVDTNPNRR